MLGILNNMKREIEKILEEFDRTKLNKLSYIENNEHKRDLTSFLKQSLEQIAKQAAESVVPEEKIIIVKVADEIEERYWDRGFNSCISDIKKNIDNLFK